jgi:hypothetical protein
MNNEDKQMTVISAEIERQRQEMAENNAEARFNDDNPWLEQTYKEMANVNWITIQVLESLLPAEREQTVNARIGGACDPLLTERTIPEMKPIAELWFDSTFKQH